MTATFVWLSGFIVGAAFAVSVMMLVLAAAAGVS